MKALYLIVAGILVLAASSARAQSSDAGCGLGSMIIKEQTKVMQVLAATTNGSTGTQIFGISSGTSNCKSQNFVMREKAVQYFAEVNRDDISREMAQGQGEKLETLAALYGCKTEAFASFGEFTQTAYGRILPSPETSVSEMVQNLNRELKANTTLAKNCQSI